MESKISDRDQLVIQILEENGFVYGANTFNETCSKTTYVKESNEKDNKKSGILINIFVTNPESFGNRGFLFSIEFFEFEDTKDTKKLERKFFSSINKMLDKEMTSENRNIVYNRTKRRINEGINKISNVSDLIISFLSDKNVEYVFSRSYTLLFRCIFCKRKIIEIDKINRVFGLKDGELQEVENFEEINHKCSVCKQ